MFMLFVHHLFESLQWYSFHIKIFLVNMLIHYLLSSLWKQVNLII